MFYSHLYHTRCVCVFSFQFNFPYLNRRRFYSVFAIKIYTKCYDYVVCEAAFIILSFYLASLRFVWLSSGSDDFVTFEMRLSLILESIFLLTPIPNHCRLLEQKPRTISNSIRILANFVRDKFTFSNVTQSFQIQPLHAIENQHFRQCQNKRPLPLSIIISRPLAQNFLHFSVVLSCNSKFYSLAFIVSHFIVTACSSMTAIR